MNNATLVSFLSCLGLLFAHDAAQAGIAHLPDKGSQYVPDQILIQFKPNVTPAARGQTAQVYGAQAIQTFANRSDWSVANLTTGQTVTQAIGLYANDPNIASVQPNYIYHTMATPGPILDPQYNQLWAVKNTGQTITTGTYTPLAGTAGDDMNLEAAWNVRTDCSSVTVAVVDSGVNYNSTDLAGNMWNGTAVGAPLHGWNFTGAGSNDPMDYNGHGTHVAGTIGAVGGNGIGITGVCWKASIMAVRACDTVGRCTTSSIIQSMDFATTHGAKIINMSLGGAGPFDQAFSDAVTRAQNANLLVVVAAGNTASDNDTTPTWPCNFPQPNVLCVAALDQNYALASFSNWGATSVDVGAPGTNILSTWNGTTTTTTDPLTPASGWTISSTTAAPGGWALTATGRLNNPTVWGSALYNASTDDRAYKTFNLSGANSATLRYAAAINVKTGDFFNANFNPAGGDPFVAGTNIYSATNVADGSAIAYYRTADISGCIAATCSIGFQLLSNATLPKAIGISIPAFAINTLVLNNTSYNTIDGTSMATPQVTGVAALVWAYNPSFNYADVANAIRQGGRTIPALAGKTTTGKAVDALGALSYINQPSGVAAVVH